MCIGLPSKLSVVTSFSVAVAFMLLLSQLFLQPAFAQGLVGDLALVVPVPSLKSTQMEPLDRSTAGVQVVISVSIKNENQSDVSLRTFVEVRNSDGITQHIAFQSGEIELGEISEIGVSWMPERPGTYTLRTFCISELDSPMLISGVITKEVKIDKR
jgi:hypothetical protein